MIRTLVLIAFLISIIYFGFYLCVSQSNFKEELTGTVCEKWIDVSETEQGSKIKPKALIESKTGEKFTINLDRKVHDLIRIGTRVKQETNGNIKILQ